MYPPDDPTRPCRPAGQGLVIMMMMMMMMMTCIARFEQVFGGRLYVELT